MNTIRYKEQFANLNTARKQGRQAPIPLTVSASIHMPS